jgi:hypothetical protein
MCEDQLPGAALSRALVIVGHEGCVGSSRHGRLRMSICLQQRLRCRHAQVIGMHHAMASAAMTAAVHTAGKAVHVFTCNNAAMMHAALEARADALVTDVPHRVLQVRLVQCQTLLNIEVR